MLEDIEIFMAQHMCQLNNCIVYKIRESLQRNLVLYFENFAGSHEHIIRMEISHLLPFRMLQLHAQTIDSFWYLPHISESSLSVLL